MFDPRDVIKFERSGSLAKSLKDKAVAVKSRGRDKDKSFYIQYVSVFVCYVHPYRQQLHLVIYVAFQLHVGNFLHCVGTTPNP